MASNIPKALKIPFAMIFEFISFNLLKDAEINSARQI